MINNEVKTEDDLDEVIDQSKTSPVILFKHSTRCPISSDAYDRIKEYESRPDSLPVFMIKVVESRPVSRLAADAFGVHHESPQVLLLVKGESVWDTSHGSIDADAISEAASQHARQ